MRKNIDCNEVEIREGFNQSFYKKNIPNQMDVIHANELYKLCEPQRIKSIAHLLWLLTLFLISFRALELGSLFIYATLLVYALHYTMHIAHECWHGILFRSKNANRVWGQFLSGILGMPYEFAKKIHFNHHRHLNSREDPGYQYTDPHLTRKEIIKKLFGTLILANHIKNTTYILNMITKKKVFNASLENSNKSVLNFRELLVPFIIHILLMSFIIFHFNFASFLIFEYCVLVLLPLVDAVRTLIDHRLGIGIDSAGFTRNCKISRLDKILTKPYFDWHLLHHLYPQIPQSRLREAEILVLKKIGADNYYNCLAPNSFYGLLDALKKHQP